MARDDKQSAAKAFLAAQAALDSCDRELSEQRYRDVAERWLSEPRSEDEDERLAGILAASLLGTQLFKRGEVGGAELWWRRAADAGTLEEWHGVDLGPYGCAPHADAAANLGDRLARRGKTDEALRWVREAAEYRHLAAATQLGVELYEQGAFEDAARWWRQAAQQGSALALYNLGTLATERGDLRDAEEWFRRAAGAQRVLESPDVHADVVANAQVQVGSLLARRGELAEAQKWLKEAEELGSEDAVEALAHLDAFGRTTNHAETWLITAGRAASDDFLRRWRGDR
jgi:TPR repeat protein